MTSLDSISPIVSAAAVIFLILFLPGFRLCSIRPHDPMNPPKGEETIFAEALRLPPEERAAYLAQSTHGNAGLRRRIECLLGSY